MSNSREYQFIKKEMGYAPTADRRKAKFIMRKVIDNNASTGKAKKLADAEAEAKSKATNSLIDADYSIENLKRLGAVQVYKHALYVEIKHPKSKDYKTRLATEEDKVTFANAYKKYEDENEKISTQDQPVREERNSIPSNTIGLSNTNTKSGWSSPEINFNYTISTSF